MDNHQIQNPPFKDHHSQSALSEEEPPTPSHREAIEGKIQQMTKSLAEVDLFSSSKPMDTLKKLQSERQSMEKETNSCQAVLFQELNDIELSLMSMDRDSMLHQAGNKICQEQIQGRLDDCRVELRRMSDSVHEKLSYYRDTVVDVKVKMIQTESQSKEKALKLERDATCKLISIEKSLTSNQSLADGIRNKFRKQFKELRTKIQTENRQLEKESIKRQILVSELSCSLNGRVEAEKIRQKDGFQQHYRTLEEIFRLLQEDIDMKQ